MSIFTRPQNPVFVALDTNDMPAARFLAAGLLPFVGGIKLGLEFFNTFGPDGIRQIQQTEAPIFLDLKLHDIPNTVAAATKAVCYMAPKFLTVHTSGGVEMMRAAAEAAADIATKENLHRTQLLCVTALTSLSPRQCSAIYGKQPEDIVPILAEMALEAGIDGLVCSAAEAPKLRELFGNNLTLVTPGIRPAGSPNADQNRVMTPTDALTAGADYLVIGRPITEALNPIAAAKSIWQEIKKHPLSA